jgi:hypothetical protein
MTEDEIYTASKTLGENEKFLVGNLKRYNRLKD